MPPSRKLILLFGLIVIVGGFFFLFTRLGGGDSSDEGFKSDNPNFIRIRRRIDTLEKAEWNVAAYRAIKTEISQAFQARPRQLINMKEQEALKRLLTSTYYETVAKAAERFCRSQPLQSTGAAALLDEFRNEFPSNFQPERSGKLRNSLQLFQSGASLTGNVQSYVTNSPYASGTTSSYQSRLAGIRSDALLSSNGSVISAVRKAEADLSGHQKLGLTMELLKADGYRDCQYAFDENSNYRKFTYYYKICQTANSTN